MDRDKSEAKTITDIESLIEPEDKSAAAVKASHKVINLRQANIPMILMMFVMVVFGLVILYSVSAPDAYGSFGDSGYFLKKQLGFTIAGVIVCLVIAFFPIKFFAQKWIMLGAYIISIGLALATLAFGAGSVEHGASRWINIGPIQLQGSEIIKVALIVAFAGYRAMIDKMRREGKIKEGASEVGTILKTAVVDFIIPVTFAVLVDVLIVLEPHFSCFIIIAAVVFMCALVSEIPLRSWIVGGLILLLFGTIIGVIGLSVISAEKRERFMNNYAHVFKRIAIFTADEDADEEESDLTKDDTRQIDNAHNALGSGGMWGVGLGNSRSKYNYVSEAQNDYIFSIYIEETGFVGGLILIIMYLVMFGMCAHVVMRADGVFARTIAAGCTALIFVEVLMNISVELQIIPATGVTLPFMSYGGTAQIMLLVAYGLILSVSRTGTRPAEPGKAIGKNR